MFVEEDELERNKQLLDLRRSVLEVEEERLSGLNCPLCQGHFELV